MSSIPFAYGSVGIIVHGVICILCTQVHVIDGCVTAEQAGILSMQLLRDNPLLHNAAVTIQACARRLLARKRCAKERGLDSTSELPGTAVVPEDSSDDY